MNEANEEAMIAGMTREQHDALVDGLNALPETMPPRAVWERIREQAEAEGLVSPPKRPSWPWLGGLAAAAALVAVVTLPLLSGTPDSGNGITVPPVSSADANALPMRLNVLRAESSQLEGELAALPDEPVVRRVGTEASIADITDRIAAIDYQLGDPEVELTREEEEIFWRERVRLMKLLVKLRYVEAQRTVF